MSIKKVSLDDVKEITLLTAKRAERLPKKILACGRWWWLRSPGGNQSSAAIVRSDGSVYYGGVYVNLDIDCVRPAFFISDLNSKIGAKVQVGNCACTVIEKNLVLADDVVCEHRFDAKSNDWDKSELKGYINSNEFLKMLEGGKNNE